MKTETSTVKKRFAVRRHKNMPDFITNKDGLSFDPKKRLVYIHVQDLMDNSNTNTAANLFRIKTAKALPAGNIRVFGSVYDNIRKANKAKEIERRLICNKTLTLLMMFMEEDMLEHKCQTRINRSSEARIGVFSHQFVGRNRKDLYLGLKGAKENYKHIALSAQYGMYSDKKGYLNRIDTYENL